MEQTECFESSAYKVQTPGNHPEESIQHSECGQSLKSRTCMICWTPVCNATCCRMPFDRQCHLSQCNIPKDLNIIKTVFIATGFLNWWWWNCVFQEPNESLGMRIGGGLGSNEGDIPIYIANIHPQGCVGRTQQILVSHCIAHFFVQKLML